MQVIVGKTAGFCYGVKRAVEGSKELITNNKKEKIYCLGELVHNKQVIEELEKQGITVIDDINELQYNNSKVIIRAHGIKEEIYEIAKTKNIELIDFTCPNVLKIHEIAKDYQKKGYYIFIIGAEKHPEIKGIASCCGTNYFIIQDENDINEAVKKFEESQIKELLVIVQTTYNREKFYNIEKKIKETISKDIEIIVKNTICLATEVRQKETEELAKKVDFMIIIGGKNSSNTKKLYEIAKDNCNKAICIETSDEILEEDLININKAGIMAGASTPQKSIDKIIEKLNKIME